MTLLRSYLKSISRNLKGTYKPHNGIKFIK
ncbi:hypothetical protein [Staphylococcus phage vB_ScaM-V1SC01]|nr:hypothetical protein [Staphylococcus phage vB_ScaM-V1SC01]WPF67532.1 hypothetical protein [Staphylococcus phage vB_SauM-V1SA12]